MPSDELSLFSYEILGLVGREGAGAHDLLRMARRGRFLDWAGESQYYVEPKRLARLGYLDARKEPGKTKERTVYTLSEKGLEALRDWARTPAQFTPVKSEVLLRLLICDLVGEAPTSASSPHSISHRSHDERRGASRSLPLVHRGRGDISVRRQDLGVQGRRKDVRPVPARRRLASGQ